MRGYVLFFLLFCACAPQVVERVVEVPVDRVVEVERVLVQCFDGSVRAAVSECPLPVVGAAVYEKEASAGAPNVIPDAYWFSEEDGVETAVFGSVRRSGDVIWDTVAKKAWVFLGDVDRKWYVQFVGVAPPNSGWTLPAYLELSVSFDRVFDRQVIPVFSQTQLVWQRLQPVFVAGPVDVLRQYAGVGPSRIETGRQSLRVMKKDIDSNQSLHFVSGNSTVVLRLDTHYGVPFVVEEFSGFHRVSRRAFLFSEYARDGQAVAKITKESVGLPYDAVIVSARQWEEYREFKDG
ncbi:hypothetical protein C4580_04430 [Candidatus Woesearchaeota archaeon]|nr:MAG: hypothetical protein C4580_04430 [Candidatus Woesearchaeota archaeon]